MKTKIFYRLDYFPTNNKGAGHLIGFFDDLSDAMVEMPYNSRSEHLTPEFDEHYTLTTYSGMGNMTPEQAWQDGYILTDDTFNQNEE